MRNSALGLVEVRGYLGAVAAADAALKAASVTCIGVEIIKGGLVTVKLDGDVGAVQAAVEAGAEMAKQLDVLITRHVIARMHEETAVLVAGPVDAGESQHQVEKSATRDEEQQKEAENVADKVTLEAYAEDNAKNVVSMDVAAAKSTESKANSKPEVIQAADTPKPEAHTANESKAAQTKKPAAEVELQAKAELVSTVVIKKADEVKPVTEQKVTSVKTAAPAEKPTDVPKSQHNGSNPRVQPKHTPTAKSSKKSKKASS
ncbi:BMC domain-containing protein [Paenibacillus sp.]|jgi:microcompartment protein CcmL/EutN|uniref:BMC domain-containing protein n=1 Tax=Paenibacillus sp. TaxID=58172 RepID=UPI0035CD03E9